MTPAEKIGLKVGDKVRVTGEVWSEAKRKGVGIGSIITLYYDDNSMCPMFVSETGYRWFHTLAKIELLRNPPTTVTGPATITVATGETITFEGNATVKQDWVPKFGDRVVFVEPPEDMVGDCGVVTEIDDGDLPYRVTYNDGQSEKRQSSNCYWYSISEIKPYEDA